MPAEAPILNEALRILHRCGVTEADLCIASRARYDGGMLSPGLQADLLDAARDELQAIRRYLSLPSVLWRSFWHRDERGILKPYRRQRHRQAFHDGVCAALLLVAAHRALVDSKLVRPVTRGPRRARTIIRVATAITGDASAFADILGIGPVKPLKEGPPPVTKSLRTRHWFRRNSTRSWQAAYNLACAYAAVAQICQAKGADDGELRDLTSRVVTSLEFAICNPECEMERPWEWIDHDPDFCWLRCLDEKLPGEFGRFLAVQKRRDYPSVPRPRTGQGNGRADGHPGRPVPPRQHGEISHCVS